MEPDKTSFSIYYLLFGSREASRTQGPSFPSQHTQLAILIGSDLDAGNAMPFSKRPGLAPFVGELLRSSLSHGPHLWKSYRD